MEYTVKQLSNLAGVSVRTLHYYDQIGLLEPSRVGENSYRYYEDQALLRLQQILFYREMELSLREISEIIDKPGFDVLAALEAHRVGLDAKIRRLHALIDTIDDTINFLTGDIDMSEKEMFHRFSKEEEATYAQEARQRWGDDEVNASYKRWDSYSPDKKEQIMAEGGAIYQELAAEIEAGQTPDSPPVQQLVASWHQHLRYFYEPSLARLRGLGQMYVDHPDFSRKFEQIHPDLAPFMREAINNYCDNMEGEDRK